MGMYFAIYDSYNNQGDFQMLFFMQLFTTNTAHALSCEHGPVNENIGFDARDIPINVVPTIWFANAQSEDFDMSLRDETGNIIEADFVESTFNTIQILPVEDLAPQSTYQISIDEPYNYKFTSFTTGDVLDEEPPTAPTIYEITHENTSDVWGDSNELILDIEIEDGSFAMIEVAYTEDFLDAEVVFAEDYNGRIWLGSGPCGSTMQSNPYDVFWIRVSAVDQAGNISEGTVVQNDANPDSFDYDQTWTCGTGMHLGCNSLSGNDSLPFILILPLMFAYRRR
jgi:hypothetical protein